MRRSYFFIVVLSVFLALYFSFLVDYETITTAQAVYGTLIVILGLLPVAVVLKSPREAGLIPLLPLHGLFYLFTFGLPVFSSKTRWITSGHQSLNMALIFTITGLVCLYTGYYAFRGSFARVRPIVFLFKISTNRQCRLGWVLFGMSMLLEFYPIIAELPSMGQLIVPLQYMSIGILFNIFLDRNLSKFEAFLFGAVTLFYFLKTLLSGSLAQPVFLLVFLGVIYWTKSRRFPFSIIMTAVVLAILLNPVKGAFRNDTWGKQFSSYTYYDKALLFYIAAADYYSGGSILKYVVEDTSTINRLAHVATFSYVIEMTPKNVPYWSGGSYETLWTSFIPRFIFPDKPKGDIGQQFGHRYKLLNPDDTDTAVNLPWLPELYANFGTMGIFIGMFAVGVFFRYLVQKLSAPIGHPIENILGITVSFNLFYAESNLSLMVGGIFLTYIAFFLLLRLLTIRI